MNNYIIVIGGGLAGAEAAYQIAKRGIKVKLYEMKPKKFSPAHTNKNLAEIVCSNSFKSNLLTNACGLLKQELRMLDSLLINIADKTKAWNKANPELRQTLNKHAAQFCKKEEYRQAQAQRMFEYDMLHPERRQKISQKSKEMWNRCPEVKTAMCQFSKKQGQYLSILLAKHAKKLPLSETEQIVLNSFFKKFWMAHPEMKKILADALSDVINEMA